MRRKPSVPFIALSIIMISGISLGQTSDKGSMDYEYRWGSPRPEGHPFLSIGGTEVITTDRWVDTFLIELRAFLNLDQGLALGPKVGSDFYNETEVGLALRKTLVDTFHAYGDLGYSFEDREGMFGEIGLGSYFWKNNVLSIHLGLKHYFGPSDTAITVGFALNLYPR